MIRAVLLSLTLSTPAMACAVAEDFSAADISSLPVVVLADVVGYSRTPTGEGRLVLDVAEVWKGAAPDRLEARWDLGMSEMPPEVWGDRPARIVAGLIPPAGGDTFRLFVEMCGQAHFVEATEANLAAIRAALP